MRRNPTALSCKTCAVCNKPLGCEMNLPIHFAQTQTQKLTDAHTGSEIKKKSHDR